MEIVDIPGLPLYGVRADGTVWSKKKKGPHRDAESLHWRQLKPGWDRTQSYLQHSLQVGDCEHTFSVHYLVSLTFLGHRPDGYHINHKDSVRTNNAISNLEYVTPRGNMSHAWDNGRITVSKPKLTEPQVEIIKDRFLHGDLNIDIARDYGVCPTTIRDIRVGKTWKHLRNTEERVVLSAA